MKGSSFRNYQAYFFILLFAILAYWPMSLMIFSAKNDAIHYFLAMRYNTSEAIQHGIFPAWGPYINLGYPLHGDIQSGVWNPLVFLMSLVRQYDIYWLHTEIILINVIAGIGMYRLLQFLDLEKKTSLIIAVAYMLNGYMTDSGQFLNWLYAGAILPFLIQYAIKAFRAYHLRDAFALGFSYSMMLLCGYPADSILSGYLLLAWFIVSLWGKSKELGFAYAFKKHFRSGFVALASFIIICLPALISFMEFFPEVRRGSGVSLDLAQSNSLAPANLISLIFPWVTLRGNIFAATDPLIRNCYIGLFTLVFLIYYFLQREKKDLVQKFLIGTMIFFLIFSLGKYGGLRYLTYEALPLMDSFRHPANAKLFFMFAGQVLAAFALNRYLLNSNLNERTLKRINIVLLTLTAVAFIFAIFKSQAPGIILNSLQDGLTGLSDVLKQARDRLTGMDLLFLNSFVALLLLSATYYLLHRGRLKKYLLFLMFLDMFIMAQLMLPLTYVRNYRTTEVQKMLNAQPKGYPLPDLNATLAENSKDGMKYFEDIGCLNPYNKKPGRSEYIITPSNLASQDLFWENEKLREKIMAYPLAYFADTIYAAGDSLSFLNDTVNKFVAIWNNAPRGSTAVKGSQGSITVIEFKPGRMVFETETEKNSKLIVLQNYYPRWRVKHDNLSSMITPVNGTFMAVSAITGKHRITFEYYTKDLRILAMISVIFALLGIIYYFISRKKIKPI